MSPLRWTVLATGFLALVALGRTPEETVPEGQPPSFHLNAERAGRKLSFNRWLAFSPDGKQLALEEYGSVYLLDRPDFNLDKARQVAIVDEKKSAVYVDGFVGPGRRLLAHNAHRLLTVDLQNGDIQPLGEWSNEHIARAYCHGSRFTASNF